MKVHGKPVDCHGVALDWREKLVPVGSHHKQRVLAADKYSESLSSLIKQENGPRSVHQSVPQWLLRSHARAFHVAKGTGIKLETFKLAPWVSRVCTLCVQFIYRLQLRRRKVFMNWLPAPKLHRKLEWSKPWHPQIEILCAKAQAGEDTR